MATPCRISPPLAIILISHRATQREGLLRPDVVVNALILYVLGYVQTRFAIEYHALVVLSNHLHFLMTDVLGDQLQAFNREFFSLLNCYWGRRENFWTTSKPNCVHVAPRAEDIRARVGYIGNNSVEAGLVSSELDLTPTQRFLRYPNERRPAPTPNCSGAGLPYLRF